MKRSVFSAVLISLFLVSGLSAQVQRPRIVNVPPDKSNSRSAPTPQPTQTVEADENADLPPLQKPTLGGVTTDTTTTRRPPVLQGQSTPTPTPNTTTSTEEPVEDDGGVIKVETTLVTTPVSVLDRNGRFISGLQAKDFKIFEDGVEQKVEYFNTTESPFTVALVLDMSNSTKFKIEEIRAAAIDFVGKLRAQDKVMIVAFDDDVKVLSEPTNDRFALRRAIERAEIGSGTSLYDAVGYVMNRFQRMEGRKAIVLFTDGVDTTSRKTNYAGNIKEAEELDALIYPIRYDTYNQMQTGGTSGGGSNYPRTGGGNSGGGILGKIIIGIMTGGNVNVGGGSSGGGSGTSKAEYDRGAKYLDDLALYSGGRLFNADTTSNLDIAFANIAEELRRQYSIGYYPENEGKVGQRKKIKVRVNRPNLVVKSRDSYIVGADAPTGKPQKSTFADKFNR